MLNDLCKLWNLLLDSKPDIFYEREMPPPSFSSILINALPQWLLCRILLLQWRFFVVDSKTHNLRVFEIHIRNTFKIILLYPAKCSLRTSSTGTAHHINKWGAGLVDFTNTAFGCLGVIKKMMGGCISQKGLVVFRYSCKGRSGRISPSMPTALHCLQRKLHKL